MAVSKTMERNKEMEEVFLSRTVRALEGVRVHLRSYKDTHVSGKNKERTNLHGGEMSLTIDGLVAEDTV